LKLSLPPLVLAASLVAAAAAVPLPQLRPADRAAAVTVNGALPIEVSKAVVAKLAAWQAVMSEGSSVSSQKIAATLAETPDWPGQSQLQRRYEQALVREAPKPEAVVAALAGREPVTADGTLLLARALVAVGRKDDAAALIRRSWRGQDLTEAVEQTILKHFREVLTPADHAARVDHFLYAELTGAALRNAKLLDAPYRALVEARVAVIRRASNAGSLLDRVPKALQTEPGHIFARAQLLRRTMKFPEAAAVMLTAPTDPAVLGDPDAWSEERREIARRLVDIGDPWTAFQLVHVAQAESQTPRVEAEFEAGWYALVFLHDPEAARPHFQAISDTSKTPVSRARAAFWLGRVAEAEGKAEEALAHYEEAARYPIAFYGQLAADKLERSTLAATRPAPVDAAIAARFADRELVQALIHLERTGQGSDARLFYQELGSSLSDPQELTLLADLAQKQGRYSLIVKIGKAAHQRGVPIGTLAFPTTALPAYSGKVGRAVIYAVARQESEFEQFVVSSAGAVGLMQVMPEFAGTMARRAGLTYSAARVRNDAAYNVQIGATGLDYLLAQYDGSHVMAFAAYNAGPGRVAQWVKAFGDPRDPDVDVVDWMERIPFKETRNYVQRAMENLGVYRALFGEPLLRIEADLKGTTGGADLASVARPTSAARPSAIGVSYTPRPARAKSGAPLYGDDGTPLMTPAQLEARIAAVEAANAKKVAYRIPGADELRRDDE
jgi:soluble lytic murein transglycosylase